MKLYFVVNKRMAQPLQRKDGGYGWISKKMADNKMKDALVRHPNNEYEIIEVEFAHDKSNTNQESV